MVNRARQNTFLLGRTLSEYEQANGLNDAALAAKLGCTREALSRLALCRCPDDRDPSFAKDVQAIASFAPCSANALIGIVRQVRALHALREQPATSAGLLMAAR